METIKGFDRWITGNYGMDAEGDGRDWFGRGELDGQEIAERMLGTGDPVKVVALDGELEDQIQAYMDANIRYEAFEDSAERLAGTVRAWAAEETFNQAVERVEADPELEQYHHIIIGAFEDSIETAAWYYRQVLTDTKEQLLASARLAEQKASVFMAQAAAAFQAAAATIRIPIFAER